MARHKLLVGTGARDGDPSPFSCPLTSGYTYKPPLETAAVTFESLVTATIVSVLAAAAIYTVEPAVTAATHRLLVVNQLTDQAHADVARAFCQQLDVQVAGGGGCEQLPVDYLDANKKAAALADTALLQQPLPEPTSSN